MEGLLLLWSVSMHTTLLYGHYDQGVVKYSWIQEINKTGK